MKPNKRFLSLLFVVTMLVGCGSNNGVTSGNETPSSNVVTDTATSSGGSTIEDTKPKYYKVLFKVDNRNYDVALVENASDIEFPDTPEKDGYTFVGWFDEKDNQFTSGSELTEDIVVEARFKAINYNINYDVNGGTRDNTNNSYTIEEEVILGEASKEGYTFDGWYSGEEKVTSIEKGSTGNINLEARYNVINHDIKYENTYGLANENNPLSYNIESGTITFYDLPDRAGFTFAGWSYNGAESSTRELEASELEGSITLKAMWNEVADLSPFTYVVDDNRHVKITGIKDVNAKEIVVPDYVYEIELGAFKNCKSVEKLTIPYTGNRSNGEYYALGYIFGAQSYVQNDIIPASLHEVTVTGRYSNNERLRTNSFYNCMNLTNIVIGNGFTYMETRIFYDCFALTDLTIPFVGEERKDSISDVVRHFSWIFSSETGNSEKMYYGFTHYNYLDHQDDYNLYNNGYVKTARGYIPNSLKNITIGGGNIGDCCLEYLEKVETITIKEGTTYLGYNAFNGCSSLKELNVPDSVEIVEDFLMQFYNTTFYNNKINDALKGDGFIYLNDKVVASYVGDETDVIIPEGVVTLADGAFTKWSFGDIKLCPNVEKITCPSSLKYIGVYCDGGGGAFSSCDVEQVILNDGLEMIGAGTFEGKSVSDIVIPDSVTYVGNDAFYNTEWLNNQPDGPVYAGKSLYTYKGSMPVNYTLEIKEETTCIVNFALADQSNLIGVSIPSSVHTISSYAFRNDTNLASVLLPDNLLHLGYMAFDKCTALSELVIPNKLKLLPNISLNTINVKLSFADDSQIEIISSNALRSFKNQVIELPSSIKQFEYCSLVAEKTLTIIIPNGTNLTRFDKQSTGYKNDSPATIIFMGTENNYNFGTGNFYYYSEGEPACDENGTYIGNYWHYDVNGNIIIWGQEGSAYFTVIENSQSSWTSYNADKLFDNSNSVSWRIGTDSYNAETGAYFVVEASREILLRGYTITVEHANYPKGNAYLPKSWVVYGSNDFDDWTLIDAVDNSGYYAENYAYSSLTYTQHTYNVDDDSMAYKYYKFVFHSYSEDYDDIKNDLKINEIKFDYVKA